MDENALHDRLWEIAGRFGYTNDGRGLLGVNGPPFDISKPNIHDSKAEFQEEARAVDAALDHARALLQFTYSMYFEEEPGHNATKRLGDFVNQEARKDQDHERSESIIDMIRRNAVDYGLTFLTHFLVLDFQRQLAKRKQELADQESVYWSSAHRAPNHYARTIALRFAKLVARSTGKYPTIGTSRDGGHPSTDFGRALEEIFELLGIGANFRNPAQWAIRQLTDDDLKPSPKPSLFELGSGILGSQMPKGSLTLLAEALQAEVPQKGSKK